MACLTKALEELKFNYRILEELNRQEEASSFEMTVADGVVERMNVIVKDPEGIEIGFQRQKDGKFKIFTAASAAPATRLRQNDVINRIRQKYSYNAVKQELAGRGYTIVEEKDIGGKTIQLVARRWR
jgi:hypothetical protein